MLKILIVVLLSGFISVINSVPVDIKDNNFIDECPDCIDIPCHLADDKRCRLRSYYKPGSDLISFHFSISSMMSGWIGLVFNNVEFPGMVIILFNLFYIFYNFNFN